MNNMEELVFAFPTDELWKLLTYKQKGLIRGNSQVLKKIVLNGQFLRRNELEDDPSDSAAEEMFVSIMSRLNLDLCTSVSGFLDPENEVD